MPEKNVIARHCRPILLNGSAIGLIPCPTRMKQAEDKRRLARKLTLAIGSIFHSGSLPYLDKARGSQKQNKIGWSLPAKKAWDSTWQESWLPLERMLLRYSRANGFWSLTKTPTAYARSNRPTMKNCWLPCVNRRDGRIESSICGM